MKFDIVRAWKDESYRQTLNNKELTSLPANPAGEVELSETELEAVYGGAGINPLEHNESYALICEINIYSVSILGNIALLGSAVQNCVKG